MTPPTAEQVAAALAWFRAHPAAVDCIGADMPEPYADDHAITLVRAAVAASAEQHAEVVRLRAELDRHRVAGDAMADDILHIDSDDPNANEWRSVRGDAPAAPGGHPDPPTDPGELCGCGHPHPDPMGGCWTDGCDCASFGWPDTLAPAAAPTDGQAPVDPLYGCPREHVVDRLREVIEWVSARDHGRAIVLDAVVASLEAKAAVAAAPAGDSAAPDGLTTGVRVKQGDGGTWGWECTRCDYRSVAWWSDRDVAERAAAEHERDRCPAAGQPVRDSQPEATAAPDGRVVGYILGQLDHSTFTLWDDDVRESPREIQIAHAEHVDEAGPPPWRCYELRDVCAPLAARPVRDTDGGETGG